jgi:PAS domain S-box-containing protein
MMKIGLGQAEGSDTALVTDTIITTCREQVGADQPKAGLVFAGPHFDHVVMLARICNAFPDMVLVGCTTSGDYTSAYGFSDDSISLMVICAGELEFGAGLGRNLSLDYRGAVEEAYSMALGTLQDDPSLCLAFPHGHGDMPEPLLDYLNTKLGAGCPVFGGAAGKLLTDDTEIRQFYNREVVSDGLPLLLISGPVRYDFAIANSWLPLGKKAEVTKTEGTLVHTIDGVSAVDFYRRYIGYHEQPAQEFILAVYEPGAREYYLVSPIEYYDSGAARFSGIIPEGSKVQLTEVIREDLIADTRTTSELLNSTDRDWQPAFALTFSCAFRKEVLGTSAQEELNVLRGSFPSGLPVMGFYGFGEIAPLAAGGRSKAQGATLILLLIGPGPEDGYPEKGVDPEKKENSICGSSVCKIDYLKRKYHRSEAYRKRLESLKEANSRMHRRIMSDMTEAKRKLKEKEEELQKSEEKFRRIVQTTGEGFILIDEAMRVIDTNDAFCNMVDRSRPDVIGSLLPEFLADEFRQHIVGNRDQLLAEDYRKVEGTLRKRNGKKIPVLIHGNPLRDDQGGLIGQMAFITDLTEQKKALALAGEVQRSLLPRESPKVHGLDIAGRNVSCDEVGGDYYDFFLQQENVGHSFSVAVGDITGHGVDAALLMSSARAFLRMHSSRDESIVEIVRSMNGHVAVDVMESGRFMTLFYLSVSSDLQSLEWVRAGHDPALIYDPVTDEFEELMGPGMALGIEPDYVFTVNRREGLHDGQVIAIGTDGVWETCNINGEMFGKERFKAVLRNYAHCSASEILSAVFSTIEEFRAGRKADDDITLVLVKVQSY